MNYYQFENGVETLDLSRYLTSNGGQALQYIARSCRLDGNNKHDDPAEDIFKAIDLLYDELKRVGREELLEKLRRRLGSQEEKPSRHRIYFGGSVSAQYAYNQPSHLIAEATIELNRQTWETIGSQHLLGEEKKYYLTIED